MPRWLIKKEVSVALSANTREHWAHTLTWTFYRHHLFGKAMCSYEIGRSNNPAIKQSTYDLYQPKIYSAQISPPLYQSKARLQWDNGIPFLFVDLDSLEWLPQICLSPRNPADSHSWGILLSCSEWSKGEWVKGQENFYVPFLVISFQSISLDQSLWILFPLFLPDLHIQWNDILCASPSFLSSFCLCHYPDFLFPSSSELTKNYFKDIGLLQHFPSHNSNPLQCKCSTCIHVALLCARHCIERCKVFTKSNRHPLRCRTSQSNLESETWKLWGLTLYLGGMGFCQGLWEAGAFLAVYKCQRRKIAQGELI